MDDHGAPGPGPLDRDGALDYLAAGFSRHGRLIEHHEARDLIAPHLDRLLRLAFLPAETSGHHWPACVDDAQLHAVIWSALTQPESVDDPSCPPWCDEHPTRHRHTALAADDGPNGPVTIVHRSAVGPCVTVEHTTALPCAGGPSLPNDQPHVVLSPDCAERPLTAQAARALASHLSVAADLLDDLDQGVDRP